MASFLALRRAAFSSSSSDLLNRFTAQLRPVCYAPSVGRSFNSHAHMKRQDEYDDQDEEDDMSDVDVGCCRRNRSVPRVPAFFPGAEVFVPFMPTRKLSQVLNLMDQLKENDGFPAAAAARGCEAKEDGEALYLRMDMPGLGKEDVKVSVVESMPTIKGEGSEEGRRYSCRMELPGKVFKVGEMKAEMKNGVLKVVVPKLKLEDRKDVFLVQVQ